MSDVIISTQMPFDLFNASIEYDPGADIFFNWKNTPINDLKLPSDVFNVQISVLSSIADPNLVLKTRQGLDLGEYTPTSIGSYTDNGNNYVIWEFEIDLQPSDEIQYFVFRNGLTETVLRSSDFTVFNPSQCYNLKIEFTDSSETNKIGTWFLDGRTYVRYFDAKKYDNKIESTDDEFGTDYEGNRIDIEKFFNEVEYYSIVTTSKKIFMSLVDIAKNDTITVNGRAATIKT